MLASATLFAEELKLMQENEGVWKCGKDMPNVEVNSGSCFIFRNENVWRADAIHSQQ